MTSIRVYFLWVKELVQKDTRAPTSLPLGVADWSFVTLCQRQINCWITLMKLLCQNLELMMWKLKGPYLKDGLLMRKP